MKRMLEFAVTVGKLTIVDRRVVAGEIERRMKRIWVFDYVAPLVWMLG